MNKEGIKLPSKPKPKIKKELPIPLVLSAALKKNKKAATTFAQFSTAHKNEYIEWITEAKTEPTQNKRTTPAIEWLTEGKPRHWKYQGK